MHVEESSDSDDPDDPSWKPEELPGQTNLRRSGRFAKKVNDVINVLPKSTSKGLTSEELKNASQMVPCPCCDYLAAFKSVLQDHYIAQHKVPNKNACLVCHLKFESSQGFVDHFEDHANGKLPNGVLTDTKDDPITVVVEDGPPTVQKKVTEEMSVDPPPAAKITLDEEELIQGVVENISEANVIDPTSDKAKFVKIPYQAAIHAKGSQDTKLKKFEEMKAPTDLVAMRTADKLKCFYKCVAYGCSFTTDGGGEFSKHSNSMHKGKKLNCSYCLKEFLPGEVLVRHMMAEHSQRRFQCSGCFYRACSVKHIKTHIQHFHAQDAGTVVMECEETKVDGDVTANGVPTENTTWPYICAIGECVFQSFDPKDFQVHNDTVHRTVSVFFCHYCKVDFISFKRLMNHYRLHGINTLQCNYCIHGAETRGDILLHLCNAHADYPMKAFKRGLEEEENAAVPSSFPAIETVKLIESNSSSPRPESPVVEENSHTDFEELLYEVVGETYYPKYLKGMATDFVCGVPFCDEKFEGMLTYVGHLRNCHAAVNFPCPHCPHVSEEWVDFKNHLMCHGPELFACGLVTCSFYDWNKNVVTEHLKSHSQSTAKVVIVREEPIGDNDIDKVKSLPKSYSAKISGGVSYRCLFCRYKSGKKNVMKNHLYSEVMYKRFSCSSCDEKHVSRREIKEHYAKRHSDQDIKCSVHPNPTIENAVQRFLDLNVATAENAAGQCGNCKKNFKTAVALQQHVYLCLKKLYQPFDCNYCKSSFHDLKILKFHADEKHFRKPLSFSMISSQSVEDIISLKFQQVRLGSLKEANGPSDSESLPICFVKFYICNFCPYESNHKHNTQQHIENEHKGSPVEISKMLRNVDMPDLTKSDQSPPRSDDPPQSQSNPPGKVAKRYHCGLCMKKQGSLAELEKHVESSHSASDEAEYMFYYSPDPQAPLSHDNRKYECSYCKSGKDTLQSLKKHSDLMHSESQFRVRGFVRRDSFDAIACGYCFQRVSTNVELKQHTQASHPTLEQKSIGGFQRKRALEKDVDDGLPNKRVRFSASFFVCSHCGAAYTTQGQVTGHSKKAHTRLAAKFTQEEAEGERLFYKCEFCQFTSEQDFLDLHLRSKHKNRVTCSHCARRFEFASKLKEHHDLAHKDLPVKYSQETLPFVKKEPPDTPSKSPAPKAGSSKASPAKKSSQVSSSTKSPKKNLTSGLAGLYVTTDGLSGDPASKLSLITFQRMYDIYPELLLKRCDGK